MTGTRPLLSIRDLVIEFHSAHGVVHAADHVSYDVYPGETLGVVGESGSGKTVTALSVLGLIPSPPGRIAGGQVLFEGTDLLRLSRQSLRSIRGGEIGMIFQDPMTSLNPVLTVGEQIREALWTHDSGAAAEAHRARALELLETVGIPNPGDRYRQYPHEFSGGMRQRAMIAMAIANRPKLLIADEPTTALDVTIQAQILDVLDAAKHDTGAATVLITHDLGLVAEVADRVVVMYAGRVVETGDVETIFHEPRHPYTLGLMASLPRLDTEVEHLVPIPGRPPSLGAVPPGCSFHPRCELSGGRSRCREEVPPLYDAGGSHRTACHYFDEMEHEISRVARASGGALT